MSEVCSIILYQITGSNRFKTLNICFRSFSDLIDYDKPVMNYWPEFAQEDKAEILVRDILSQQVSSTHDKMTVNLY